MVLHIKTTGASFYTPIEKVWFNYNIIVQTLVSILPQIYLLNTSKFNLFGLYT